MALPKSQGFKSITVYNLVSDNSAKQILTVIQTSPSTHHKGSSQRINVGNVNLNLHQIHTLRLVWATITKFLVLMWVHILVYFTSNVRRPFYFMSGLGRKSEGKLRGRPKILDPHYFNPN